jgi:hypothetical protein
MSKMRLPSGAKTNCLNLLKSLKMLTKIETIIKELKDKMQVLRQEKSNIIAELECLDAVINTIIKIENNHNIKHTKDAEN